MIDILGAIGAIGGAIGAAGGIGALVMTFTKRGRRQSEAETVEKEVDALNKMRELVANLTDSLKGYNDAIDKEKDEKMQLSDEARALRARNRELSDKLYASEQDSNRLNERIQDLMRRLFNEVQLRVHYQHWLCKHPKTHEGQPCLRIPPQNPEIVGHEYEDPVLPYDEEKPELN